MSALDDAMIVYAPYLLARVDGGRFTSTVGAAAVSTGVEVVPGAGGQVLRLYDSEATVTGAGDFSDKHFTVGVWFRGGVGTATRTLFARRNGMTAIVLSITRDGLVQAYVASAKGKHSMTITGTSRVDDQQWHLVMLRVKKDTSLLGSFAGNIAGTVIVDGDTERDGWIKPGLFQTSPDVSMDTPIVIGRDTDGSTPVQGEVGPVAVWRTNLATEAIRAMVDARPEQRHSVMGWGIPLG